MDRFDALSIGTSDKKCGVCGMENGKSNCCHDESIRVKSGDDHSAVTSVFLASPVEAEVPSIFSTDCFYSCIKESAVDYAANAPPPQKNRQSFFCIWRI
jgi:hypothetical protein